MKTDDRVELRVPTASLRRWHVTAGVEGLTLSAWIRKTCDAVAVDQQTVDTVRESAERRKRGRR